MGNGGPKPPVHSQESLVLHLKNENLLLPPGSFIPSLECLHVFGQVKILQSQKKIKIIIIIVIISLFQSYKGVGSFCPVVLVSCLESTLPALQ